MFKKHRMPGGAVNLNRREFSSAVINFERGFLKNKTLQTQDHQPFELFGCFEVFFYQFAVISLDDNTSPCFYPALLSISVCKY